MASNCYTTSLAKGGPPEAREGEGEAGRGEGGTTRAISQEAEANPSEGPAAMATVTSGTTKSAAASSLESLVARATTSLIVCCES